MSSVNLLSHYLHQSLDTPVQQWNHLTEKTEGIGGISESFRTSHLFPEVVLFIQVRYVRGPELCRLLGEVVLFLEVKNDR